MKVAAIVNSRSRKVTSRRMRDLLESELELDSGAIVGTEYAGHARELAREFSKRGFDVIIVCGGDGTINEAVNGMDLTRTILGIVPLGTANDLAHHYGIPTNLREALTVISSGHAHQQDLISVNGWKYATVGGIGLGSQALQMINVIRSHKWADRVIVRAVGCRLYNLGLALALLRRDRGRVSASMQWGGCTMEGSYDSIIIGNQALLGKEFRVLPDAVNNDGCFETFTISAQTKMTDLIAVIYRVLRGTHLNSRHVCCLRCKRLLIETNKPSRFFCDGEIGGLTERFEVELVRRGLTVMVPDQWTVSNTP